MENDSYGLPRQPDSIPNVYERIKQLEMYVNKAGARMRSWRTARMAGRTTYRTYIKGVVAMVVLATAAIYITW